MIQRPHHAAQLDKAYRSRTRVVCVTGLHGTGKTTLARAWARTLPSKEAISLDLATCTDLDALLIAMANTFDADDTHTVEALMRERGPLWLILDHADHLIHVLDPLITHWLAEVDTLHVYTLAHQRLANTPHAHIPVGGLTLSQGIALCEQWGELTTPAQRAAAEHLIELLDGHPGALTWLARRQDVYALATWAEHLQSCVLGGEPVRPPGHTALMAQSFLRCWNSLSEHAQQLCLALTQVHGAHTLATLHAWLEVAPIHPWMLAAQEAHDASFLLRHADGSVRLTGFVRHMILHNCAKPDQKEQMKRAKERVFGALEQHCAQALRASEQPSLDRHIVQDLWAMWCHVKHRTDGGAPYVRRWVAAQLEVRGSYSTWLGTAHVGPRSAPSESVYQAIQQHLSRGQTESAKQVAYHALTHPGHDAAARMKLQGVLARVHRQERRFADAATAFSEVARHAFELGDEPRGWRNVWRQIGMLSFCPEERTLALERCDAILNVAQPDIIPRHLVLHQALEIAHRHDLSEDSPYLTELIALDAAHALPKDISLELSMWRADLIARTSLFDAAHHYLMILNTWDELCVTPPEALLERLCMTWGLCGEYAQAKTLADRLTSAPRRHDIQAALHLLCDEPKHAKERWEAGIREAPHDIERVWMRRVLVALTAHTAPGARADFAAHVRPEQFIHTPEVLQVAQCGMAYMLEHTDMPELKPWRTPHHDLWLAHMICAYCLARTHRYIPQQRDLHHARAHTALILYGDCEAALTPEGAWVDLSQKPMLSRLLQALVNAHTAPTPHAIAGQDLFHEVWTEEPHTAQKSAINRVRVMLSRLRSAGLKPWVVTTKQGYQLAEGLTVIQAKTLRAS